MNAHDTSLMPAPRTSDAVQPNAVGSYAGAPSRYRDRDIGVGYGRSSGYAFDKRYTSDWGVARFRFR
jgi:hypothetical protein